MALLGMRIFNVVSLADDIVICRECSVSESIDSELPVVVLVEP